MTNRDDADPLVLSNQTHLGTRLLFACLGMVPLIWPAWDLRPWNIQFGISAIFVWIIVLGAVTLGLAIILLMAFAPNSRLIIARDGITVHRRSIFGASCHRIDVSDIAEVGLNRTEWQDGADSFAIRVTVKGASDFVTAPIASQEQARQLLQMARDTLDASRSDR